MHVRPATSQDFDGFLTLASEVEHWFGPMVAVPGFHQAVKKTIAADSALCVDGEESLLGGMLFGGAHPTYQISWLVVSAKARGTGIGSSLLDEAVRRFTTGPATLEVVTFGADHPAAKAGGARIFYERHGFTSAEAAPDGPEGGTRQWYRRALSAAVHAGPPGSAGLGHIRRT